MNLSFHTCHLRARSFHQAFCVVKTLEAKLWLNRRGKKMTTPIGLTCHLTVFYINEIFPCLGHGHLYSTSHKKVPSPPGAWLWWCRSTFSGLCTTINSRKLTEIHLNRKWENVSNHQGLKYWERLANRRTGGKIKSNPFKTALDHFLKKLSAITGNWTLLGPKNTHCYWDYNEKRSTRNERFILAKSEVLKKQE